MADNCIFCKIIAGEVPGKIVYQDELLVALEDINPQAPYHFLLVPRKHIRTTLDLTTADNEILGRLFQVAEKLAQISISPRTASGSSTTATRVRGNQSGVCIFICLGAGTYLASRVVSAPNLKRGVLWGVPFLFSEKRSSIEC